MEKFIVSLMQTVPPKKCSWFLGLILVLSPVTALRAAPSPIATEPRVTNYGIGMSNPGRPNISQSPYARVYKWNLAAGDSLIQVNNLAGKVLGYAIVGPTKVVVGQPLGQALGQGAYQCPCQTVVLGSGPGWEVIGVLDAEDRLVNEFCVGTACHTYQK